MAVLGFQEFMLPTLKQLANGEVRRTREVSIGVADALGISEEERQERISSGDLTYLNRAQWAQTYLNKAGLIERPQRGVLRISDAGRQVLAENPTRIDLKYLSRYPAIQQFKKGKQGEVSGPGLPSPGPEAPPDEQIRSNLLLLNRMVADDLLTRLKTVDPTFFEELVVRVLVAMGYGGSLESAGKAIGRSGDGGIDGIVKEDKLGLDVIAIQAKRWEGPVGRPVVQAFVGSLMGHRVRKGVLITTSTFTADARDFVKRIDTPVVLVDGEQLAQLMIEYDLGVTTSEVFRLKKFDPGFFEDA